MKIHILGICGTFMSGIAILAKKTGHTVTGSDRTAYDPIKSVLDRHNIKVTIGHKIKDIKNKDLIIIGNVMSRGNPVIEYILKITEFEFPLNRKITLVTKPITACIPNIVVAD